MNHDRVEKKISLGDFVCVNVKERVRFERSQFLLSIRCEQSFKIHEEFAKKIFFPTLTTNFYLHENNLKIHMTHLAVGGETELVSWGRKKGEVHRVWGIHSRHKKRKTAFTSFSLSK